ncbi:ACR3 family arsenite efflux pump ArsB [Natronocella acetinitrilica]|uniref:ACR3 family arsenite efflux pump ArsB n=1 Tax=Natronocella acetinitrilica TaxID=414046 RepID=A0AAE3KC57_9GAMM|nr:hypothetical protein [Natronocella acetinitrilica]MCP1675379.1 ACR3 family arsenite efflux pump ArsB [Natronocella acetinitrilica]
MSQRDRQRQWRDLGAYALAPLAGLAIGVALPGTVAMADSLLWPTLALLLFVTFLQVPLVAQQRLPQTKRYMLAAAFAQFLCLPLLVGGLLLLVPDDPGLQLAVCLVLLAPCTDWFVTFSKLSRGSVQVAVLSTPMLLIGQLVMLPVWIYLLAGSAALAAFEPMRLLIVFSAIVLLPLGVAMVLQRLRPGSGLRLTAHQLDRIGKWLLVVVLGLIGTSQLSALVGAWQSWLLPVAGVYLGFAVGATAIAVLIARAVRLRPAPGRTLLISLNARNSFVVLPVALASGAAATASAAIVLQMLLELFLLLGLSHVATRLLPGDEDQTDERLRQVS